MALVEVGTAVAVVAADAAAAVVAADAAAAVGCYFCDNNRYVKMEKQIKDLKIWVIKILTLPHASL